VNHRVSTVACVLFAAIGNRRADGSVDVYFDFDKWKTALGSVTTIGFSEYSKGTGIFDQYIDEGVLFPDEDCFVIEADFFPIDGHGLHSSVSTGRILVSFTTPQYGIASHFPGDNWVTLFSGGELLYEGLPWGPPDTFIGYISDRPFDSATITTPATVQVVTIDNLYFGVPGPGALPLLALAGLLRRTRRRRS
jgi:hypothetical protein